MQMLGYCIKPSRIAFNLHGNIAIRPDDDDEQREGDEDQNP